MMDAYAHLDMSCKDPIFDFKECIASAGVERALLVETWNGDNSSCLKELISVSSCSFAVALCFRTDDKTKLVNHISTKSVTAFRVRTSDLEQLEEFADILESYGKVLLPHAENGIGPLVSNLSSLVRRHPRLRVYVPHFAWPRKNAMYDTNWNESIKTLACFPSIVVGVSAIAHFSQETFPHRDIEPFAFRLAETFGIDSLAVGSDYPLFERERYPEYMKLAMSWINPANTLWTPKLNEWCFQNRSQAMP